MEIKEPVILVVDDDKDIVTFYNDENKGNREYPYTCAFR